MRRWKKILLIFFIGSFALLSVAIHSRIAKQIAGFVLTPRIEAWLEPALHATVLVGGLDYRLWRGELVLEDVEAESENGSWRMSLPEARLRFSLRGNITVDARGASIRLRRDIVEAPAAPPRLARIIFREGSLRSELGSWRELSVELVRVDGALQGKAYGTGADGQSFERLVSWSGSQVTVQ